MTMAGVPNPHADRDPVADWPTLRAARLPGDPERSFHWLDRSEQTSVGWEVETYHPESAPNVLSRRQALMVVGGHPLHPEHLKALKAWAEEEGH